MTWQITSASEPGTSHVRRGLRCQDAYASWQDRICGIAVLAVADGAGSARRAGDGARIAVATAVEACTRRLTASAHGVPETVVDWEVLLRNTLEAVRHEIERVAADESDAVVAPSATAARDGIGTQRTTEGRDTNHEAATPVSATHPSAGSSLHDFSTTLLVAVLAPGWLSCLQVGDGVIVARHGGGLEAITRPAKGEYANKTDFVTIDEYKTRAQFRVLQRDDVDALAMMSDGLERLAVDPVSNAPFAPFLESLFAFASSDQHEPAVYSKALAQELRSDTVNRMTHDDKTPILATRRGRAPNLR